MKKNAEAEFLKAAFPADDRKVSRRRIDRAVEELGTSPEPSESPRTALNHFYDNLNVPRSETVSMGQNKASRRKWNPARVLSFAGGMLVLFVCVSLTVSGNKSHPMKPGESEIAEESARAEHGQPGLSDDGPSSDGKHYSNLPVGILICTDLTFASSQSTSEFPLPTSGSKMEDAQALLAELVLTYPESRIDGDGSFILSISLDETTFYQIRFESEAAALASDEPLTKLWKLLSKQ